jgi:hypothetical protein
MAPQTKNYGPPVPPDLQKKSWRLSLFGSSPAAIFYIVSLAWPFVKGRIFFIF